MAISLKVNGATRSVEAEPDTPLLYVLRNDFELNGAKFGCGLAQCGACTVLVNVVATRSCSLPISQVGTSEVTTLEGLGTLGKPHPLQKAFIDEQAAQCGYCANGMIMTAVELLKHTPRPSEQTSSKRMCVTQSSALMLKIPALPSAFTSARSPWSGSAASNRGASARLPSVRIRPYLPSRMTIASPFQNRPAASKLGATTGCNVLST